MNFITTHGRFLAVFLALALGLAGLPAGDAGAVLSERGGTGVWELQSAESKRAGRLELGFFGSYKRFGLGDPAGSRLHGLRGGANAAFGLSNGFEISGTLPVFGYYTTTGTGSGIPVESISARPGDLSARLRWTGPFALPGLRMGVEGDVRFATGSNRIENYPGRGAVRPYTHRENSYTGRTMLTWDATRAGAAAPLRLHANGAYTFQGDETRYVLPQVLLPLPASSPLRNRDNDFLTLGGAVEVDLPRFTLFGEFVTDQFVNDRGSFAGRENRMSVTPGIRFWLPGGSALTGAYSFDVSKDDARTAFKPREAWAKNEWRVALSLGTVYRRATERAAQAAAVNAPLPAVTPERPATSAGPAASETARVAERDTTTTTRERAAAAARIERRDVQEDAPATVRVPARAAMDTIASAAPAPAKAPARASADTMSSASPAPAMAPAARPSGAVPPATAGPRDSDGDGTPDDRDGCPLLAEDWDGFQDFDGCPDLDNDQDGIPDVRDQCPNDPETYNGYYDFDGCPDEVAPRWIGTRDGAAEIPSVTARSFGAADTLRAREPRLTPAAGSPAPAVTVAPAARAAAMTAARAVSPAATTAPAVESSPVADSLRNQLELLRTQRADLEARLEQSQGQRDQAMERLADLRRTPAAAAVRETVQVARTGPPAAVRPAATTVEPGTVRTTAPAMALAEENQRRLRDLELANAELRGRLDAYEYERGRTVSAAPPVAPALISAPRIEPANPAPAAATAAPRMEPVVTPASPRDTSGRLILNRLEEIRSAMDSLRTESATPEPAAPAMDAAALDRLDGMLPLGRSRVFPEVQFAPGGSALTGEASAALARVAGALADAPEARVRVVGHTDDSGRRAENLRLSRERALRVAEELFAHGVSRAQVMVDGRGEEAPIASNATADGRQANRRVEFVRVR